MTEQQPDPLDPMGTPGDTITITRADFDETIRREVAAAVQDLVDNMPEVEVSETDALAGYAVYDQTYLRFVGPIHDTKAAARAAAKASKVVVFNVREV
jgi:hypothetical protein